MGARILVIDDDRGVVEILVACFEMDGHCAVGVMDGEAGIRAVAAEAFDLVITDYKMPGIDGLETARRIRALRPHQRIVMISGHVERGLRVLAEAAGIECVLEKPLPLDRVSALVQPPKAEAQAS